MRQKRIKYATKELLEAYDVVVDLKQLNLPQAQKVYLEIGSGKGQFIAALAKDHPEDLFIAMEINISVCYRILEKRNEMKLDNLIIIHGDASNLSVYFEPDTIDGLYLNFSDPWPKKRHHKRRLTSESFIKDYLSILKDEAFIQFRTDHIELFQDSLTYMEPHVHLIDVDFDLNPSNYMTEYEVKKRALGPIFQLIGKVDKHAK